VSLSNLTRNLKFIVPTIIAVLFVSLISIDRNVGATLILETEDQANTLQQEVDTILKSITNIMADYNNVKQSISKIIDIIVEKQASPGVYYEHSELPPLPTNQSTTSQFDSELPPLPTNQSTTSQFDSELPPLPTNQSTTSQFDSELS
jgi:hypothetical protein